MKKLTCKDLGGPCNHEIVGKTFEEIGRASYAHVVEQIKQGDKDHMQSVEKMRNMSPEEQEAAMAGFKKRFGEAPEV